VAYRDAVGAVNILSRKAHGELAKIVPPPLRATTYRYPVGISRQGTCSRLDTPELARLASVGREAAAL
jgi:hypothetical protein